MMNTLYDYQKEVAAILAADPWINTHEVAIIAENSLDLETEIQAALESTGILATVNTPAVKGIGEYAGQIVGEIEALTIVVAETVAINRQRPNGCTALDAGVRIAGLLHSDTCTFLSLEQAVDEQQATITCTVRLATSINVSLTASTLPEGN